MAGITLVVRTSNMTRHRLSMNAPYPTSLR